MHNDKIGWERGAIKAMKILELIIAFKEQLCKLWFDKDKLYICTNVVKITQLVYTSSSKRKNVLLGSISAQSMASYLPVDPLEIQGVVASLP